jgi:serine/threonine protein kinase
MRQGNHDEFEIFKKKIPVLLTIVMLLYRYSYASDVWSVGVCMYELLTLECPFIAHDLATLTDLVVNKSYKPIIGKGNYGEDLKKLIYVMLEKVRCYVDHINLKYLFKRKKFRFNYLFIYIGSFQTHQYFESHLQSAHPNHLYTKWIFASPSSSLHIIILYFY